MIDGRIYPTDDPYIFIMPKRDYRFDVDNEMFEIEREENDRLILRLRETAVLKMYFSEHQHNQILRDRVKQYQAKEERARHTLRQTLNRMGELEMIIEVLKKEDPACQKS